MTIKWQLEEKKISALKQYGKNPRYITKDEMGQLKTSIGKFGLIDKPIVNLDGTVIGGHQRINALKSSGIKTVDCWIPDRILEDNEVEELCIRLNKNVGEWDWDILASEWNVDSLIQWGFTEKILTGEYKTEELEEKKGKKNNKIQMVICPECGHEFEE